MKLLSILINLGLGASIWWHSGDFFEGMGAGALGPATLLLLFAPLLIPCIAILLSLFQSYIWRCYENKTAKQFFVLLPILFALGYKGLQETPALASVQPFYTSFIMVVPTVIVSFFLVWLRLSLEAPSEEETKAKRQNDL